jgi:hypothetical protein
MTALRFGSERLAQDHVMNVFAQGDDQIRSDFTRSMRPCGRTLRCWS